MTWTHFLPFTLFAAACSGAAEVKDTADENTPEETDTQNTETDTTDSDSSGASVTAEDNGDIVINELLAKSDITDDWIELYNKSSSEVDLSGWNITDDAGSEEVPWPFPAGTKIEAGGFLLIWANDGEGGELSTDFKLSKDGETVTLLDGDGNVSSEVIFPALEDEYSAARTEDGGSEWTVSDASTPGASNQ